MRGKPELKKKTGPICVFENQPELLNKTIVNGINRYLETEQNSSNCCISFFDNKPQDDINTAILIKLMLDSDLDIVCLQAKQLFCEDFAFMPYILVSISLVLYENKHQSTSLNFNELNLLFQELGKIYRIKFDINAEKIINKLIKICIRYKIIFVIDDLDKGAITTPPIQNLIDKESDFTMEHLSQVFQLVLKIMNINYKVKIDNNQKTISIVSPYPNRLGKFQIKLLQNSKAIRKNFFLENKIIEIKKISSIDVDKNDNEKNQLISNEKIIYKSKYKFKELKPKIKTYFNLYDLDIQRTGNRSNNEFIFTHLKKTNTLINYFNNLYIPNTDDIFTFKTIEEITEIINIFLDSAKIDFLKIKLNQLKKPVLQIPVNINDEQEDEYLNRIDKILPSLKLKLKDKKLLLIETSLNHPIILFIIKLVLTGVSNSFNVFISKYTELKIYYNNSIHSIEKIRQSKFNIFSQNIDLSNTNTTCYIELSKQINSLQEFNEIKDILGKNFEVTLLNSNTEKIVRPRLTFFKSPKNKVNNNLTNYRIIIRGKDENYTQALVDYYEYIKINMTYLPDEIKSVIFEYLETEESIKIRNNFITMN